jgi:ABC-type polysaccharide/polyol phosphate transport system ATPase subunit
MFDNHCALVTRNLRKSFPVGGHRTTLYGLCKRAVLRNGHSAQNYPALDDINIEVSKGEKVGIIGNNGAGKTTFLKVIAGLHKPTSGAVTASGEAVFLAGLGVGMVDELSVSENIFLYGAIHGMDRTHIRYNFDDITQWAELEKFVDAKLKTLSSGMRARLAFSIVRHIATDIMLVDEALTAGDKDFNQKCEDYFRSAKNGGRTFLVATHDLNFVKMFCDKTLWLHKGRQMAFGDTESVLGQYSESKSR